MCGPCSSDYPSCYRVPLVLVYMRRVSPRRKSQRMLDVPLGTVLARLHRGRKLFEKQMWVYAVRRRSAGGGGRDDQLFRGRASSSGSTSTALSTRRIRALVEEHLTFCLRCCCELEFAEELRAFPCQLCERRLLPDDVMRAPVLPPSTPWINLLSRDFMHTTELNALVRYAYRAIVSLLPLQSRTSSTLREELCSVPRSAIDRSLRVSNHLRFANIEPATPFSISAVAPASTRSSLLYAPYPTARVIALYFLPEML